MNERIKELAVQVGIHFRGHRGSTLDAGSDGIAKFVMYSDMEKFAELIVRECQYAIVSRTDLPKHERKLYNNVLKEHFGIEE